MPRDLAGFLAFYRGATWNPDAEKISRAQNFFEKHATVYLSLLGFYSLPYTYAFADGAQVLVRSKRILENTGRRLDETLYFVLEAFRPGTFLGNEQSLLTLAKVRLIHAYSRHFIQAYVRDWDPAWGQPINQEDLLGTNLSFSLIVMRGFGKAGISCSQVDIEAMLHYWKWIGYANGVDVRYWPDTAKEAYWLEKRIRERHVRKSDAGTLLIGKLLQFYQETLPTSVPIQLLEGLIGHFLGAGMADVLSLSKSKLVPDTAYRFLVNTGFFTPTGSLDSYPRIRRFFEQQLTTKYGEPLLLHIPVPNKRS
nr:oxygenase MpaB family protein [Lunatimonas sp.]